MLIDIILVIILVLFIILLWILYTRIFGAEWVKIPKEARIAMLNMLKLNKNDIFYDLGCGDGQLLIEAAPKVKKAVGIEIDPIRYAIAKARTKNKENIKIIHGNLFKLPLKQTKATKIGIFLCPETNIKLGKKLKRELKPKTKIMIASYKWQIPKLKLIKEEKDHRIFLYQKIKHKNLNT